ncbi:hypothetical protein GIB67_009195 [Kingdonia uniflora]|uniref:KAT8 regulatory NSL complex subunit 2 n=1 Tax=Kingdonia uniflora TaxID=39325 RepID=A0A7J7N315_9MAGN|nr:hypothetical protein GIB67_009195 [Kingdonia uniflora]
MEDLRVRYRDYYWKFGKGPYKDEEEMGVDGLVGNFVGEESGENNGGRVGFGVGENGGCSGSGGGGGVGGDDVMIKRCVFALCKSKAMALTNYCHTHILADARQTLYTACIYNIKSAHTGPVHCGKPILKATVPSLCSVHFQKAQKHVARALKKAGLHIPLSSKLAPKFHVIVAESVRQINAKRRERRANAGKIVVNKKDNAS